MLNSEVIQGYFNTQLLEGVNLWNFYADLLLTALLGFILNVIYVKFGTSLSNRKVFGQNFVLLSLTTMLIISIVKSSLALSLGLVGALSIVRFRSAIKEPEELAYLFLSISIGLGFGAGQRYLTLLAILFIFVIIVIKGLFTKSLKDQNLFLTLSSTQGFDVQKLLELLSPQTTFANLKRFDLNSDATEAVLYVKFKDNKSMDASIKELQKFDKNIKISFIEDKGVFS